MHNAPVDHHDGPHQLIQIPVHCQGNLSGVRSPRPASAPLRPMLKMRKIEIEELARAGAA
jgi:hypothetical protein